MLTVSDANAQLINQWDISTPDSHKNIEIIFHCSELITHHMDEKSLTIFYGFLDQEYSANCPAMAISKLIHIDGLQALNKCYGSFIVVHYDFQNRELLVANDGLGDFATHYTQTANKIIISDLPEPLVNAKHVSLNEYRILHFFAHTKPQNNGCFFNDIIQLNPGYGVTIKSNGVNIKRYYYPSEKINFKAPSSDVLIEQFNALMQSAIAHQTKGQKKIGVMMSGGMDSTFVAAHALNVNKHVASFSYVFPNLADADESHWIDAFRQSKLDMHTFSGESLWPLKSPVYASSNSPILNPYRPLKDVIYSSASQKNIQTLLTGGFADHLYVGYIYWLVDLIKTHPLKGLMSLIQTMKDLGIKTGLRQISPQKWGTHTTIKAPWMQSQALAALQNHCLNSSTSKHPHPQQWDLAFGISTAQSHWLENEYAFKHNLHIRHPFRDRRVVEFLMALPAYVLGTINNPKAFVRDASQGLLPDTIIKRKRKTTLAPLFNLGVLEKEKDWVMALLSHTQSSWHHYIDKKLIHRILHNPKGDQSDKHLAILWQCIGFELWQTRLRTLKSQT